MTFVFVMKIEWKNIFYRRVKYKVWKSRVFRIQIFFLNKYHYFRYIRGFYEHDSLTWLRNKNQTPSNFNFSSQTAPRKNFQNSRNFIFDHHVNFGSKFNFETESLRKSFGGFVSICLQKNGFCDLIWFDLFEDIFKTK